MARYFFILFALITSMNNWLFAIQWLPNGGGNWSTGANWDGGDPPGIVPKVGADALFPDTMATYAYVTLTEGVSIGNLYNQRSNFLTIDGYPNILTFQNPNPLITVSGNDGFLLFNTNLYSSNPLEIQLYNGTNTTLYFFYGLLDVNGAVTIKGPGRVKLGTLNASAIHLEGENTILEMPTDYLPDLVIDQASSDAILNSTTDSLTVNSNISGLGSVFFSDGSVGGAELTLTGSNTLSGDWIFNTSNSFSIIGSTASLPQSAAQVALQSGGCSLVFSQSSSGTFAAPINGLGSVVKRGAGSVTLSNSSGYSGTTTIEAGGLSVTGSITASDITVDSGAHLKGTGSVKTVINNGTTQPGLTAGDTLTITEDYTQGNAATFSTLVSSSAASQADIQGAANLSGVLNLHLSPGVYRAGTTYTVLAAAGGITDDFSSLTQTTTLARQLLGADLGDWRFRKVGNNIEIYLNSAQSIIPVPLSALVGNSRSVGEYMFSNPTFDDNNSDLLFVSETLTNLSPAQFKDALIQVSPIATAGVPFSTYQSDLQMAVVLDRQFKKTAMKTNTSSKKASPTLNPSIPKTGLFIEPIGVFYRQNAVDGNLTDIGQIPFNSYTYGTGLGWEQVLNDQIVLEGGLGYTHSNLNWDNSFGNSKWNTLYLAPFVGWFSKKAYGNFMILAAFNFFNTDRKIQIPGINRTAKSRYNSYDLLLRANGGINFFLKNNFWSQLDGTLNYLTIFTDKYQESGAGSINLQVKRHVNYIMQPSVRFKFFKEFYTRKICFAPNIYLGWLANILLQNQTLSARFTGAPNNVFFNISGYQKTTNQLVVGAEYYMENEESFIFKVGFEADLLSRLEVYTIKIKFQKIF